jgi:hypothetical protein
MSKVATPRVFFRIPIVCQLNRCIWAIRCSNKNQREAPLLIFVPTLLNKAQRVDKKIKRRLEVADADHGVKVFHYLLPAVHRNVTRYESKFNNLLIRPDSKWFGVALSCFDKSARAQSPLKLKTVKVMKNPVNLAFV